MDISNTPPFKAVDADPGGTLKQFNEYVDEMKLLFSLVFRKNDGTAYQPSDAEKKAMILLKGGRDMRILFEHVGMVLDADTFEQSVEKITNKLKERTNQVVQRNMLLSNHPQGTKSFEKWSREVSDSAKLIDFMGYDWKQAAVDAMILQTTSSKLREKALSENASYEELLKLGITKEQSEKGGALLEQASGNSSSRNIDEEVRRLKLENRQLKRDAHAKNANNGNACYRCTSTSCPQDQTCTAMGKKCGNCGKMNHLRAACKKGKPRTKFKRKPTNVACLDSDSESEMSGRIVDVSNLGSQDRLANISVQGRQSPSEQHKVKMVTDTGVRKTLVNKPTWQKIKPQCGKLVKTSKRFRPYGTHYLLPIIGRAQVTLQAENGACIKTWICVINDMKEQCLLGENDACRLGIVTINLKGAEEEVIDVHCITPISRSEETLARPPPFNEQAVIEKFPGLFTNKTGKYKGEPIPIQMPDTYYTRSRPERRIPLHYKKQYLTELERMKQEDIIEGPLEVEEPGTIINNVVLTDKKDTDQIRITLDCQTVNEQVYQTHEPIPTPEELRHEFSGSECFSKLDMTNCYHQFEIEEKARKLFAFRTPLGIFQFKRMVPGVSPASSEVQKRVREMVKSCPNTRSIKDDILVHSKYENHEEILLKTLQTLQEHGVTVRPDKCKLGRSEVKWFGYIFSRAGMSPDPEKCNTIKNWPSPKNTKEVKSFLQTVQFNSKFLGAVNGDGESYPELTNPLRKLTQKKAKFVWGSREETAFIKLKERLCDDTVMAPYDTSRKTRLYVDSSPVGTQATLAQLHQIRGTEVWRPVNHTSRSWTPVEARYGQIERESNGILTGMLMNKMYTLGTQVEVVTDHKPLLPIYQAAGRPRQLRVDRHRTKLLPFNFSVTHEPGVTSPCDYGSRHPESHTLSSEEIEEWGVETGTEVLINRVIEDNLPRAVTIAELKKETAADLILTQLIPLIGQDSCNNTSDLKPYNHVFQELWTSDGLLMRNDKIVIPRSLQARCIEAAHEGHQYITKTLQLLRQTCWFPEMHKLVANYVSSCIPCNSASHHNPPVPLEPNLLPDGPWQKLHADFKGPIAGSYYVHVVIDQYSKYPEVDIMRSTSFKKLKPALDRIFATHGIPESLTTDNGPPYFGDELESYAKCLGFELTPVTPEDPRSNGFA